MTTQFQFKVTTCPSIGYLLGYVGLLGLIKAYIKAYVKFFLGTKMALKFFLKFFPEYFWTQNLILLKRESKSSLNTRGYNCIYSLRDKFKEDYIKVFKCCYRILCDV